jgi:hypothetical protein
VARPLVGSIIKQFVVAAWLVYVPMACCVPRQGTSENGWANRGAKGAPRVNRGTDRGAEGAPGLNRGSEREPQGCIRVRTEEQREPQG